MRASPSKDFGPACWPPCSIHCFAPCWTCSQPAVAIRTAHDGGAARSPSTIGMGRTATATGDGARLASSPGPSQMGRVPTTKAREAADLSQGRLLIVRRAKEKRAGATFRIKGELVKLGHTGGDHDSLRTHPGSRTADTASSRDELETVPSSSRPDAGGCRHPQRRYDRLQAALRPYLYAPATRRVLLAAWAASPNDVWMTQQVAT